MIMEKFKIFLSSILAGMAIAIGGIANLTLENKVAGAIFFTAGLFTVCVFGFHLFTGKVCYVFENKAGYIADLIVIWLEISPEQSSRHFSCSRRGYPGSMKRL